MYLCLNYFIKVLCILSRRLNIFQAKPLTSGINCSLSRFGAPVRPGWCHDGLGDTVLNREDYHGGIVVNRDNPADRPGCFKMSPGGKQEPALSGQVRYNGKMPVQYRIFTVAPSSLYRSSPW